MRAADLRDAQMERTDLREANVIYTDFRGAKGLSEQQKMDLRRRGAMVELK
ncbi:MAG: pentapeptide repeat-containing protein [Planctomycetota bacterium]